MSLPFSELLLTKIHAVNRIELKKGTAGSRTNRDRSAFACKLEGLTRYESDNEVFLSQKGCLIFLPRGADYTYACEEEGTCIMVEFDTDPAPLPNLKIFSLRSSPEIDELFRHMERTWTFRREGYYPECMSAWYKTVSVIEKESALPYELRDKIDLVRPSLQFLESHYADSTLNVGALAAPSGISEVYFRRLFTRIYGVPPARYLRNLRIQKAKELLTSDYGSVRFVAESVGIPDVYHFSKCFKAETGLSPASFAKSGRGF